MPLHVRHQLRDAAATALGGLPTTAGRVFPSRVYPLEEADLPGLAVYTDGDDVVSADLGDPPVQERTVALRVEAFAAAAADLDDTLDRIAAEVEAAIAGGLIIGGRAVFPAYAGCEIELRATETKKPHGSAVLAFTAQLYTLASDPTALA